MRTNSPYYDLKWLVEVQNTTGGGALIWETMCAFNVDSVAMHYADDCNRSNPHLAYRVRERLGNGTKWSVIHETSAAA